MLKIAETTRAQRHNYFSIESVRRLHPSEKYRRRIWSRRFFEFDSLYINPGLPLERPEFHYRWAGFFYDSLFSDEPYMMHSIFSGRTFWKTLEVKTLVAYILAYRLTLFAHYMTESHRKAMAESADLRRKLRLPLFVQDFAIPDPTRDTTLDTEYYDRSGAPLFKMVFSTTRTFDRGVTFGGYKPTFLITDDIETRSSLFRPTDTVHNRSIIESDAISSLEPKRHRIINLSNYISTAGNQEWLRLATDPDKVSIVGIYTDETETELSWAEYHCFTDAERTALRKRGIEKISIESLKRSYLKRPGGLRTFNEEMLCRPLIDEDLYHGVKKIRAHCAPRSPILNAAVGAKDTREHTAFSVYRIFDPALRYVAGIDLSEGIGLDSHAMVLIGYDKKAAYIVAVGANNRITQKEWAHQTVKFWTWYGVQPFVVPEANMGEGYIGEMRTPGFYPTDKLYIREKSDDILAEGTVDRYGLQVGTNSRTQISGEFRHALETGALFNLSDRLHAELLMFSNAHQQQNSRVTFSRSDEITSHFDILAAARVAWAGIEQDQARKPLPSLKDLGFYNRPTAAQIANPYKVG